MKRFWIFFNLFTHTAFCMIIAALGLELIRAASSENPIVYIFFLLVIAMVIAIRDLREGENVN